MEDREPRVIAEARVVLPSLTSIERIASGIDELPGLAAVDTESNSYFLSGNGIGIERLHLGGSMRGPCEKKERPPAGDEEQAPNGSDWSEPTLLGEHQ